MLAAVVEKLFFRFVVRFIARTEHDEGLDLLDLIRVFDADDAGQKHLLIAVDDVFQLAGIDVVAGGDDHALHALREEDEAVLVHLAEIARVEPDAAVLMAAERVGRFFGIIDVAQHDGRARDADFALEVCI